MQPYANTAQSTQLFEYQKSYSLCFTFFSTTCQEKKKKGILRKSQQRESLFLGANKERKQDALKVVLILLAL